MRKKFQRPTDEQAALKFIEAMKEGDKIAKFLRGGSSTLSSYQTRILIATNDHFGFKPVNILCCADEALRRVIEATSKYNPHHTPTPVANQYQASKNESIKQTKDSNNEIEEERQQLIKLLDGKGVKYTKTIGINQLRKLALNV